MILFQFDSQGESFLVVVLEKANLDRMSQADPITLNPVSIGGTLAPITNPRRLHLLVAYEPDSEKLNEVADREPSDGSRQRAIFKFVMRGFQVTDKDGPEGIAKGQREAEERRAKFTPEEEQVIEHLGKLLGLSRHRVLVQALRCYQQKILQVEEPPGGCEAAE